MLKKKAVKYSAIRKYYYVFHCFDITRYLEEDTVTMKLKYCCSYSYWLNKTNNHFRMLYIHSSHSRSMNLNIWTRSSRKFSWLVDVINGQIRHITSIQLDKVSQIEGKKQEAKREVQGWESNTREDTKSLLMSVGCRLC